MVGGLQVIYQLGRRPTDPVGRGFGGNSEGGQFRDHGLRIEVLLPAGLREAASVAAAVCEGEAHQLPCQCRGGGWGDHGQCFVFFSWRSLIVSGGMPYTPVWSQGRKGSL